MSGLPLIATLASMYHLSALQVAMIQHCSWYRSCTFPSASNTSDGPTKRSPRRTSLRVLVAIPVTSCSYPMTWQLPMWPFTHNPIVPSKEDMLYMDKLHDTTKELQIDKTSLKLTLNIPWGVLWGPQRVIFCDPAVTISTNLLLIFVCVPHQHKINIM